MNRRPQGGYRGRRADEGRARLFAAHTQPGFQAIAAEEITARLSGAVVEETHSVGEKNGLILFDCAGDAADLLGLRTVEDVFHVVTRLRDVPPTRQALELLQTAATRARFDESLALTQEAGTARFRRGDLPFRVIVRQVGRTTYPRPLAEEAVARGIAGRHDHRWRLRANAAVEVWLTVLPGEAILALRLSDARMRHRDFKLEHLPASLRPSAAAALVWLTRPSPNDIFMDPMCGAGTILIERANAGRYRQLLGGDIRPEAVQAALANIGTRYQPIEIHRWDAADLPVDAGSIAAMAVNLPFGHQIGTPAANAALYPAFLREASRVLSAGARLVALTGDPESLNMALQKAHGFARRAAYPVRILGRPARIFVLQRT